MSFRQHILDNNLEELKKQKIDNVNQIEKSYKNTPLHDASYRNYLDIMEFLLMRGADPNVQNISGQTPLHLAADQKNIKAYKLLKKYGANETIRDYNKKTPKDVLEADGFLRELDIGKYGRKTFYSINKECVNKNIYTDHISFKLKPDSLTLTIYEVEEMINIKLMDILKVKFINNNISIITGDEKCYNLSPIVGDQKLYKYLIENKDRYNYTMEGIKDKYLYKYLKYKRKYLNAKSKY